MPEIAFDVAVTTYHRPEMVLSAIGSCLRQGDRLRRVVVVDDASHDGTEERIRELGDPRVVLHTRACNGGIGAARRDAMALCEAEWTVLIDSDHELLPGALDVLAEHIARSPENVGIVGARHRWDTGDVTPKVLPEGIVDYRARLAWSSVPDSIGTDYLCCMSRRVREAARWSTHRSGLADTLFQLDAARVADATYVPECLTLQKSNGADSVSRGSIAYLIARRTSDAEGGVALCAEIMQRHGGALRKWGRRLGAYVLNQGAIYASLLGRRGLAVKWAIQASLLGPPTRVSLGLVPACVAGGLVFTRAYRGALIRGGARPE